MISNVIAYVEMDAVCIGILALLIAKGSVSDGMLNLQRIFIFMLGAGIVFFALDALWVLIDGSFLSLGSQALDHTFSLVVRTLYWLAGIGLAFLAYLYFQANQEQSLLGNGRRIVMTAVPFIAVGVLAVVNLFTGVLFTVDATGAIYTRGPLFIVQPIVALAYLAFASFRAWRYAESEDNVAERSRFLSYAVFPLPIIVGELLQMFLWQFPLLCAGIALAVLNICLDTLRNMVSIDQLTQLNNRTQFTRSLTRRLRDGQDLHKLCFMALDVDLFKQVNDTYGHLEGDHALLRVANALRAALGSPDLHSIIARFGGDEFMAVVEAETDAEIEALCEAIRRELAREDEAAGVDYRVQISIGWARWDEDTSTSKQLMERADAHLYEQKRARAAARRTQAA